MSPELHHPYHKALRAALRSNDGARTAAGLERSAQAKLLSPTMLIAEAFSAAAPDSLEAVLRVQPPRGCRREIAHYPLCAAYQWGGEPPGEGLSQCRAVFARFVKPSQWIERWLEALEEEWAQAIIEHEVTKGHLVISAPLERKREYWAVEMIGALAAFLPQLLPYMLSSPVLQGLGPATVWRPALMGWASHPSQARGDVLDQLHQQVEFPYALLPSFAPLFFPPRVNSSASLWLLRHLERLATSSPCRAAGRALDDFACFLPRTLSPKEWAQGLQMVQGSAPALMAYWQQRTHAARMGFLISPAHKKVALKFFGHPGAEKSPLSANEIQEVLDCPAVFRLKAAINRGWDPLSPLPSPWATTPAYAWLLAHVENKSVGPIVRFVSKHLDPHAPDWSGVSFVDHLQQAGFDPIALELRAQKHHAALEESIKASEGEQQGKKRL